MVCSCTRARALLHAHVRHGRPAGHVRTVSADARTRPAGTLSVCPRVQGTAPWRRDEMRCRWRPRKQALIDSWARPCARERATGRRGRAIDRPRGKEERRARGATNRRQEHGRARRRRSSVRRKMKARTSHDNHRTRARIRHVIFNQARPQATGRHCPALRTLARQHVQTLPFRRPRPVL